MVSDSQSLFMRGDERDYYLVITLIVFLSSVTSGKNEILCILDRSELNFKNHSAYQMEMQSGNARVTHICT